jgi:sulfur-oxidizing protein SoxZ
MSIARLRLPDTARRGEIVEIRLLVQHPMESGFRRDMQGRIIPMNVVNQVVARYEGREIFRAELGSGVAANPYLSFFTTAGASGEIEVSWVDDAGERGRTTAQLKVT